jgi:hypothetical protein
VELPFWIQLAQLRFRCGWWAHGRPTVGPPETDKAEAAVIPKPLSASALVGTGFARKQAATGDGGACSLLRTSLSLYSLHNRENTGEIVPQIWYYVLLVIALARSSRVAPVANRDLTSNSNDTEGSPRSTGFHNEIRRAPGPLPADPPTSY